MCGKRKFNRRKFHPLKGLFFVVLAVAFVVLTGNVVMYLWNAILPDALGTKPISFWQAIGLFVLSRILIGSIRYSFWGRKKRAGRRKYWKEKWMKMEPEERDQFKRRWKDHCKGKD